MSKNYRAILENNKDNFDMLRNLAQECNSWDGSLDYLEVHEFDDDFFNTYFEGKVMEAVRATHFGNIDSWNDEYIRFNGYGNLESLSKYTYEKELEDSADEIIERALELIEEGHIDIDWLIENYDLEEAESE